MFDDQVSEPPGIQCDIICASGVPPGVGGLVNLVSMICQQLWFVSRDFCGAYGFEAPYRRALWEIHITPDGNLSEVMIYVLHILSNAPNMEKHFYC